MTARRASLQVLKIAPCIPVVLANTIVVLEDGSRPFSVWQRVFLNEGKRRSEQIPFRADPSSCAGWRWQQV